jgi:hypothetical protein
MIDINRLKRNHVFNVRTIKEKYYVVVMIPKDDVKVEVEWDNRYYRGNR